MKKVITTVILIVGGISLCYGEMFNLEVYASKFDSIPIAVTKFSPKSGGTINKNQPWKVIADDLAFTGKFEVLKINEFDSARIAEKSIGVYIDGEYMVDGNNVTLDCHLRDVTTRELIFGRKYQGEKKFLRSMAHRYANELVDMLMGERGMFETKVVFVRDNGSKKNLFVMDYDGHGVRRITNLNTVNIFPCFLDSSTVLWISFLRGKPDIYKGSISSGNSDIFMYSRFVETSPAVSLIEGNVAYASSKKGNLDIYVCNTDKTNVRQLTFHRAIDTSPTWSPNGYHIAFTSDRSGSPQIYVMDRDGANARRLTFEGRYQDSPAWSPKGDKIAYASLQKGKFDIWTIEANGSNAVKVSSNAGNNEYPCWAPDGSHIAFVCTRGGKSDIHVVRPDGSDVKKITNTGDAKMPDWLQF
ncbi:MAG: Tol-Pal system beta propeller repeat protein TolB [Chitinivibrionales bacterium]|nr:Tol-Pal system beta propeller repeat protein TolB [Chitinivibrionales bacterium]